MQLMYAADDSPCVSQECMEVHEDDPPILDEDPMRAMERWAVQSHQAVNDAQVDAQCMNECM